jgi:hypothetical protein
VLQKVRESPRVTGTQIANEILEMYKKFCDVSEELLVLSFDLIRSDRR